MDAHWRLVTNHRDRLDRNVAAHEVKITFAYPVVSSAELGKEDHNDLNNKYATAFQCVYDTDLDTAAAAVKRSVLPPADEVGINAKEQRAEAPSSASDMLNVRANNRSLRLRDRKVEVSQRDWTTFEV